MSVNGFGEIRQLPIVEEGTYQKVPNSIFDSDGDNFPAVEIVFKRSNGEPFAVLLICLLGNEQMPEAVQCIRGIWSKLMTAVFAQLPCMPSEAFVAVKWSEGKNSVLTRGVSWEEAARLIDAIQTLGIS